MLETLDAFFGTNAELLTPMQILWRTVAIYLITIVFIRAGQRRALGRTSPLDIIMTVILASVMSRAVNGTARFSATVEAGAILVALHWAFTWLTRRFRAFERVTEGKSAVLIKSGEIQKDALRAFNISDHDLREELRLGGYHDPSQIEEARIERNGRLSLIPREQSS